MQKIVKCKPVDTAEGKFDLVEVILEGDTLTHWLEFKQVEVARTSKTLMKPNKLSIKNTAARLHDVNGILAKFPVLGNTPMVDDELCNILYQMVKHDWRNAFHKSRRNSSSMNLQDLTECFEQIELLEVVKQKSKTIVVDDNNDTQKKSSNHCTKSAKAKANAKGKPPRKERKKVCVLCQQFGGNPNYHTAKDCYRHKVITSSKMQNQCKCPPGDHMSMEDLYTSNLKLTKRLKKYKKKGKCKSSYELESSDSDSDSS
eukprot:6249763-Ditylum_brightwellii.AAC.1